MNFINDYDVKLDIGKTHKGRTMLDLLEKEPKYMKWFDEECYTECLFKDARKRISQRRGVTSLIGRIENMDIIPEMIEIDSIITPVFRDPSLNACLFGSFIEYLVKAHLGLNINDQPQQLLAFYGLADAPSHFLLSDHNRIPDKRIIWIKKSYDKEPKNRKIRDIANLSLSHSILMGSDNEHDSIKLFAWVAENEKYLKSYLKKLSLPIPVEEDQKTCDKISVGCVMGVIDMISNDSIVDIKCCQKDDLKYYRKQLFSYACLHHLRYKSKFEKCEIYNFITGKQYVMFLGDSCEKHAHKFISNLGSHCKEHVKLFN